MSFSRPDGQWVLYTIGGQENPNSYVDSKLAIQSIETGERHVLNVRGEMARYVEPGFLVIARNGSLLAAPFSLKTFNTTQSPVPVLDNVDGDGGSGVSYFSISNTGRLVYIPGIRNQDLELIWVGQVTCVQNNWVFEVKGLQMRIAKTCDCPGFENLND